MNLTAQAILNYASWGLTAVILVLAVRMGMRERTPFYVFMVFAAAVGAFGEPLYDVAFMLYFYSTHGMVTHFTAFDIPQPIWTHSGYVVLYAVAAVFFAREVWRGTVTRRKLFIFAGIELAMSAAFEIFGINAGTYSYWGPHVLRIFNYPLVIGILEAVQVICFTVVAAQLRARATAWWQLLGLFVIFPVTFFGANFGAGMPTIIALHSKGTSSALIMACTLASIALAVALVAIAGLFVPGRSAGDPEHRAGGVSKQLPEPVLGQSDAVEQR
ncbi:hypothetical protein AWC19_09875 [Mycobacterium palustre]|uniref:Uncharacterized protein n=1 Tax=Mycobacterium palustre TaxID=153971 RepID=A0A1X1ZM77_9MYCO|nr:hypothetical protein AWC19_09875 [Mycobacterium palustre]